jgi:hypothetical protein
MEKSRSRVVSAQAFQKCAQTHKKFRGGGRKVHNLGSTDCNGHDQDTPALVGIQAFRAERTGARPGKALFVSRTLNLGPTYARGIPKNQVTFLGSGWGILLSRRYGKGHEIRVETV